MFASALLLALLPAALSAPVAAPAPEGEHMNHLSRRFDGRATYYIVGLGACGWYNSPGDYIVALNSAQYGGGYPGPQCGKSITISYGGKTAVATIADECPTCDYGGLDMSEGLFTHFAATSVGQFQMSWVFNDGSGSSPAPTTSSSVYTPPAPTSTYTPPTSTYTPPATSTYTPPASTSTSTTVPNLFATTSVSASGSATPSASAGASSAMGNLVLVNQLVANYGGLIVAAASTK